MANDNKITRRAFFKDAAVAGAAVAATGLLSAAPAQAAPTVPEKWDKEADVVVVGYGGAGAVAAITAAERGAHVLVLEKQAEDKHTANTQMCYGVFVSPSNVEDAIAYMGIASRVNVDIPESKDIPDDVIRIWAEYMFQNKDWVSKHGAKDFVVYADKGRDESWPGNAAIQAFQIKKDDGTPGVGVDFFKLLDNAVKALKIETIWQTPAVGLIANPDGEIIGVKAKDKDGKELVIKAAKGVILSTGGFEFNDALNKSYLPVYPMVFYGNPDNTGEGITMAQEHGADLWHMTVLGGGLKAKFTDFPTAFMVNMGSSPAYMVVDKTGKRFVAEEALGGYSGYWNAVVYDTVNYTWPRIPAYWVFDEDQRKKGPIVPTVFAAAGPIGMYEWSKDNSKEIEKGWIMKGESIEELAKVMEVDTAILKQEFTKYNGYAQAGQDQDFGRSPKLMQPLTKPPFYAVRLWPGLNNTYGGPRRNAKSQVVRVDGKPIPRLYSAGELGSIYVQYPQGGANVGECIAFGRLAGENAVAEKAWDATT